MLRTVFMGTPEFAATVLQQLLFDGLAPVAVVCQPARATGRGLKETASEVELLARDAGLPIIATPNINTPENIAQLKSYGADLFLVAAFGQLLKKEVLAIPKLYSLNVHGSLLPKYRGAAPIQRAVLDGQPLTGITIQRMVLKMDAGDMVLQMPTPIGQRENAAELFKRLAVLGGEALVKAVRQVEAGQTTFTPQDETEVKYAPKITKDEAMIDWSRPAETLLRQIRGLQPWPIAETKLDGVRLKIFDAEVAPAHGDHPSGTITTDNKTRLFVTCGHSTALSLTQIQLENRKKLETRDFLMAYRGKFPHLTMG
jgi:methionyl-tRNA formyltransferase